MACENNTQIKQKRIQGTTFMNVTDVQSNVTKTMAYQSSNKNDDDNDNKKNNINKGSKTPMIRSIRRRHYNVCSVRVKQLILHI